MRARGGRWLTSIALCLALVRPAAAESDVSARARRLLDDSYQTALPDESGVAPQVIDPDQRPIERRHDGDGGGGGSGLAYGLLIAIAVAVVAGLGVWMWRELSGYGGPPLQAPGDAPPAPAPLDLERPLADADQLARAGRYAEAMHVLLARTLGELLRVRSVALHASWTSREVLARVGGALPGGARDALAGLIGAVEVTWFGDDIPSANDYANCVGHFQRVVHEVRA